MGWSSWAFKSLVSQRPNTEREWIKNTTFLLNLMNNYWRIKLSQTTTIQILEWRKPLWPQKEAPNSSENKTMMQSRPNYCPFWTRMTSRFVTCLTRESCERRFLRLELANLRTESLLKEEKVENHHFLKLIKQNLENRNFRTKWLVMQIAKICWVLKQTRVFKGLKLPQMIIQKERRYKKIIFADLTRSYHQREDKLCTDLWETKNI